MTADDWKIFLGSAERTSAPALKDWLAAVPPWRQLTTPSKLVQRAVPKDAPAERRGKAYVSSGSNEILRVNMALMLRRPLLVTGPPGIGKSSLAYNVAWCLGLGTPLRWEINSRTVLQDGLYTYDAVGHMQEGQKAGKKAPIGKFITLGPLGTALLPTQRPRVLLIDEIDKASFDLPNDLLHVFEEGSFTIPELVRLGGEQHVFPYDATSPTDTVAVSDGRVSTQHHPVVVITSNGERSFSDAFLRRCVRLELTNPDRQGLVDIVAAQLGESLDGDLVMDAIGRYSEETTDVVLQAIFLQQTFGLPPADIDPALRRKG